MKIEQIYTGCLAQGAYYIVSNGEAAIIDPLREVKPYLDRLKKDGATLKFIFETHFHADFVSGHLELSASTGAPIVFGPTAKPDFKCIVGEDNQIFQLGDVQIKLMHTPGHTMESSCFLLLDENGIPHSLFSGDTLFLGDVGRPDLAQKAADLTQEELAGLLYESIYNKIIPLDDSIMIYPAHGAGSACGKNMMKETVDSLGHQKEMNYALNQSSKEDFVTAVLDGLQPPPAYFPMNVAMNKFGYSTISDVLHNGLRPLSAAEFQVAAESQEVVILDTRAPGKFAQGFIPQSINIGLDGQFAPWVGAVIGDVKTPILLVTEVGREEETILRLARVGFDIILGYLKGGFETWLNSGNEIDSVNRISAQEFANLHDESAMVVDVRKEGEYAAEHVEDAYHRPLDFIHSWSKPHELNKPFFLHCAGGYRSMIAASILKKRGIHDFKEVDGGFAAIAKTDVPKSDFVCQSKVLK